MKNSKGSANTVFALNKMGVPCGKFVGAISTGLDDAITSETPCGDYEIVVQGIAGK